jgi:hypothetical protein
MGQAALTRIETHFPISETVRKIETHYYTTTD